MWHTLGFDAGRFAFTAVDVSDFFDVNSVCATPLDIDGRHMYGRNSSDCGRVTLAHVFENPQHKGYTYQPGDWDAFMDNYLDSGKVPLVSVADLNLAMNKQGLPAYMSPFCNYILNSADFVSSDSRTDPEVNLVRNMAFVTDGLFAITNRVSGRGLNLANASDQPFYGVGSISGKSQISAKRLLSGGGNAFTRYMESPRSKFNNDPEYVQLLDYLDENSVPATLALPTVERTPMITGVSLEGEMKVLVTENKYEKDGPDANTKYEVTTWTLKLIGNLEVNVGAVHPFKYDRGAASPSYQAEAVATIAFVPSCNPESSGLLRCPAAAKPGLVILDNDWGDVATSWRLSFYNNQSINSVACKKTAAQKLNISTDVTDENKAVTDDIRLSLGSLQDVVFTANLPATECYNGDTCSFRRCRKMVKVMQNGVESWVVDGTFEDAPIGERVGFLPVAQDLSGAIAADDFGNQTFTPTVQVWVRIFGSDGTVDLVPACWRDDKEPADILQDEAKGSSQYPFLRFRARNTATAGIQFSGNELKQTGDGLFDIYPQAYMADDPRFNYAPENLICLGEAKGDFKKLWLEKQRSAGRDGDIFMATSDAGYMQSVYELTHLVATCRVGGDYGVADGNGYDGNARTDFASCPADAAMWRTYSQYDGGWAKNDIDRLDVINGSRGFRVSPYTQSADIMLAALANTPLDWWAASTNETVNETVHGSAANAAKYSFSEMNGAKVQLKHANLESIARDLIADFRDPEDGDDWRRVFDDRAWRGGTSAAGGDTFCGVTLDNGVKLHSVDRKFLHGFWKESIANRQQLFLVFVRAEPMMMGGGGMGQTPPQLGGRAVALVWRDPTKTRDDVSGLNTSGGPRPHRTRVLFYRQFD